MRRAKIIGTLGPATSTVESIAALIRAGLNVARVNMSHGSYEDHAAVIARVREASRVAGQEVAILMDLQGPKIRVARLAAPLQLTAGDTWVIGPEDRADNPPEAYRERYIPTTYRALVKDATPGGRILFDDGLLEARALRVEDGLLVIEIVEGGELKSNKGINLPDSEVSAPTFTEKDRADLEFGLANDVDYLAMSFVRRRSCVLQVKQLLHAKKRYLPIIAKVERPEAVDNIEEICDVADAIMIARGDMAVELGNQMVPPVQRRIIQMCRARGKPVITATQMLESMISHPRPTRAEASDVANAIWDGSDAVMLSGETSVGRHPVEVVKMMDRIICQAERVSREFERRGAKPSSVSGATMMASGFIASWVRAPWILAFTRSGNSCWEISRSRPVAQVFGVARSIGAVRRMCLFWGITPYLSEHYKDPNQVEDPVEESIEVMKSRGYLTNGDRLVITFGDSHLMTHGTSNAIRVEIVNDARTASARRDSHGHELINEVVLLGQRIALDPVLCTSCQNCVKICPHGVWVVTDDEHQFAHIDPSKAPECSLDMECIRVCPSKAIHIGPVAR
ncbi:MAG: pyruvate kinase [Magnetococcus sp. WYHC-3]